MDDRKPTRFSLIDAIALVAATAAGLGLARAVIDVRVAAAEAIIDVAVCLVASWTLALLALNLTRYRTTLRELSRRPGVSAGVAFLAAQLSGVFDTLVVYPKMQSHFDWPELSPSNVPAVILQLLKAAVGLGTDIGGCGGPIAAAWIVIAMAGCWRAERTWIDRTGRAIGIFWLLTPFIGSVNQILQM